jgi:phenylalanyl-tRNA synthetase beta chain
MRISLNWLNDYVDIKDADSKDLAEKITRAGVNIEGIKKVDINNLVVGYVEEKTSHPDSDHLNVCKVNLGHETVQIVCGAPNVDKGQKVIVATEGAVLPGGFEIKKTTIRGVESNGMICALFELGLEDKETNYHKGIHILGDDAVLGSDPLAYLGLDDTVYELDLNPNRNDCLSHLGFAYEAAAVLGKKVILPEIETVPISDNINNEIKINVNTNNCTMYKTRIVKDVVIGESPAFIKNRLTSAGMRPINNVVDISNYIMLEYGQPLHFFDKEKVGSEISVRMANNSEEVITLDGKNRVLNDTDIVITNNEEVIAIAGVMGCANSEVDTNTKDILIESALFNPYNVRYTSIRLGLRSEASLRFEKGLNYEYTNEALERACYLLCTYANGKVMDGIASYDKVDKKPKIASVTREKINNVLGMTLSHKDIMESFEKLNFPVEVDGENYKVIIPNRRMDVSIREDLIEEVGRLYGYDNIIGKLPFSPMKRGGYNEKTKFRKIVSKRMRSLGLNEIRSYLLISPEDSKIFKFNGGEDISLQLPMSTDKSVVRQTAIPSLLKAVEYNLARNVKDINIYEISNVYYKKNNEYVEESKLSIAMLGDYLNNNWQGSNVKADFYLLKGIIENLLNYLGYTNRYKIMTSNMIPSEMHPLVSAVVSIDNEVVGYFGKVHPSINKLPIFVGELNLDAIYNKKTGNIKFKDAPKFPSIVKDMAFIIDKSVEAQTIMSLISKVGGKTLQSVDVFDVYVGENVDDNKKSLAFTVTFNDQNKTLTDEEVNALFESIIKEVEIKFGAILRSK